MKILLIDESIDRVGGVERVISTLANKLSQNNEVKVLSEFKIYSEPFHKYSSNVKIEYLINSTNQKTNDMKKKDFKYYFYRLFEKIKKTIFLKYRIKKTISQMKEIDTIIFGRVFVALDFLPYIKKRNLNINIIVRDAIHLEYYNQKTRKKMLKYFPSMINKMVISSEESKQQYNKFFGKDVIDMVKIYNPIGIIPKTGFEFNSKTVVSIGRFDEQKGFKNLIEAFAKVHKEHKEWKLRIYGNGNYESILRKEINNFNGDDFIELLPATKDVVSVFNQSSIFVLPSRYEGYANILVEAMACGMPCISYNWLMGVEEIIKDKENGIVIPLYDRKKYFNGEVIGEDIINLVKGINYLIENKEYCEKIGKEASKIVETRNIEHIVNEWMKIIN